MGRVGIDRLRHLAARVARAAAVSFGVLLLSFLLIRLVPGDPAVVLCDLCSPADIERLRAQLGLSGSTLEQFVSYAGGLLGGDLGTSIRSGRPVVDVVMERLPISVGLVTLTLALTTITAVPIGLAAAWWRRTWFGQFVRILTAALVAVPVFFSGVVAILVFAVWAGVAPVGGFEPGIPESLRYLWLPALVMAGSIGPIVVRLLQESVTATLAEEFVEAAIVRGVSARALAWRYLLRPSLGPTIALLGYISGALIGSAVLIELVFNLPGMGYTLIDAVLQRDYPMVQGMVFVSGLVVVLVNLVAESAAAAVDPRLGRVAR